MEPKKIKTAYDAYWFIHNHPNCIQIDPEHPIIKSEEYEFEGFKVQGKKERWGAHKGKPRDADFVRAQKEWAFEGWWNGQFINNMSWDYHMVNPETRHIDDDKTKNTREEVWLETGPAYFDSYTDKYQANMHDTRLDCGGATMEEALINMAEKVKEYYGDY